MGVVTRKGQEVERKFSSSTRDLSVPRRRECRGRRVRGHHILGCNRGRLSAETRGEFTLGRLRARLRRAVPKRSRSLDREYRERYWSGGDAVERKGRLSSACVERAIRQPGTMPGCREMTPREKSDERVAGVKARKMKTGR